MLKFFKIWEMWFERWFENVKTYWVAKGLEELCTAYQSWTKFHIEFWTRRLLLNPLWWTTHLNCCYHPDRRDDENNNWLLSSMVVFIIIISLPGLSYFIGKLPFPEKTFFVCCKNEPNLNLNTLQNSPIFSVLVYVRIEINLTQYVRIYLIAGGQMDWES